ncbi:MAG: hypothetical protein KR126chlam1_01401 [Chlamydiae bacterium]|nr:hypothetical protein [Chlamydiota bacterium]
MKKILFSLLITVQAFAGSIGEDNNAFAFSLYSKIEKSDENVVFSPYSIFTTLSLLYFGAEGQTAEEIKKVLHLSATKRPFLDAFATLQSGLTSTGDNGYRFTLATGLFPNKGTQFTKTFREIAVGDFHAKIQALDYDLPQSVTDTINDWISEETNGYIPNLIHKQDINTATRLVIANALFFEGAWMYPFPKEMTRKGTFVSRRGSSHQVEMMRQTRSLPYFSTDDVEGLFLPFARNSIHQPQLQLLILLPKNNGSFPKLTQENLENWQSETRSLLVSAQIPKFCFSKRILLNTPLKELGMKDAFTYQADFSNINGMKDLFLNKVLHETYFSLDEKGVTAASATAAILDVTSFSPTDEPPIPFIADHPFQFLLLDSHSGAILFMGQVNHPAKECHEN